MSLIHAENISMIYGSPSRTILDSVDLEIYEGEFVCVLGQTGCGKSTLLRLILGSEQPSQGRILVDGREHKQPDRTRGYVPQKYSLFPDKTVLDNITFRAEVSEFSLWSHLSPGYFGEETNFEPRLANISGASVCRKAMRRNIRTSFRGECSSAWQSLRR